jgi:ASPIC and UnbV
MISTGMQTDHGHELAAGPEMARTVRVVAGEHAQMDEVHSGSSVMSQGDLRLHFGLGETAVDLIEVKWPTTGKIERFYPGEK